MVQRRSGGQVVNQQWVECLIAALGRRRERGELSTPIETRALRLWYGLGEARTPEHAPLKAWAVDGYGRWLWITEWEQASGPVLEIEELARGAAVAKGHAHELVATRYRRADA
jgi:hypothetical protein